MQWNVTLVGFFCKYSKLLKVFVFLVCILVFVFFVEVVIVVIVSWITHKMMTFTVMLLKVNYELPIIAVIDKWNPVAPEHGCCWLACVSVPCYRLWTSTVPARRCGWVDWAQRGQEASITSLTHTLPAFCECCRCSFLMPCVFKWKSKVSAAASPTWVFCCHLFPRWVNTLGTAAVQGIDVVLRHSFFDYGYTHLVDQNFNPLPVSV